MADGSREVAVTWTFGAAGGSNNLNSTGAAVAYNTFDLGERFTFTVETDGSATGSYQIRNARTASGPWLVLSSGTLSTGAMAMVQSYGPLGWLSPYVKTLNSTSNRITIRATAI